MEIHERIKAAREDKDLTQDEVAEMLNIVRKQIYNWETGKTEMGITKLKALCLIYGVSADYILGLPRGLDWPRR